tara:strand:+ start:208 stop:465 length:258 start_codon:yes stop_codon:yes gene_type:complete
MHILIADIVFSIIGRLFLIVRYRKWSTARKIRDEKYAGSYSAVGRIFFLDVIALCGATFLMIVLIAMIIGVIWKLATQGIDGLSR